MTEEAVEGTGIPQLGGRGGASVPHSALCTSGDLRMLCMTIRKSSTFGTLRISMPMYLLSLLHYR